MRAVSTRVVGLRNLLRAVYLTFSKRKWTLRRTAFLALALSAYCLLYVTVGLGQALDEVIFRGYRTQAVRSPIFIIATPRSGTTFLHRMMCLDEAQFTYLKTYETLLPSVSLFRLIDLSLAVDDQFGRYLPRIRRWIDRVLFAGWKHIHPTGLSHAEEDEGIFLYPLHSPGFYLLFPFVDEFRYMQFTDNLPTSERSRVMSYYRRSIQRYLYAHREMRTLLSKNVHSSGRVFSLLETFPDARFIFIVRSPYQAIPSLISLFYTVWQVHSPDIAKQSPETRALAQMGFDYYHYMQEVCQRLPPERYICIQFEDLVQDPERIVERIYGHLGLAMSDAFRAQLRQAARERRERQNQHHYSLCEFGLDEEMVRRELGDVFPAFGFSIEEGDEEDAPV